jgi:hypothetical protein
MGRCAAGARVDPLAVFLGVRKGAYLVDREKPSREQRLLDVLHQGATFLDLLRGISIL